MSKRIPAADSLEAQQRLERSENFLMRESTIPNQVAPSPDASATLIHQLLADLQEWTNCQWAMAVLIDRETAGAVFTLGSVPDLKTILERVVYSLDPDVAEAELSDLMVIPIRVSGQLCAGVTLGPKWTSAEYTDADLALIRDSATQIAGLLERQSLAGHVANRLLELQRTREEVQTARRVQRCLLPTGSTRVNGVEFDGEWQPVRELGGDFFDFIPVDSGLVISIGDISGHGIPAALLMAGTQASLRVLANTTPRQCANVVNDLNRLVCGISPDNVFATLFYSHIDASRGKLTYVSAGHEPALLVQRRTGAVRILESTGTVLGLSPRSAYAQRTVSIGAGDILVAFTDGVTEGVERSTGQLLQVEVVRMLQRCPGIGIHELVSGIMSTATAAGEADDKAVIAVRVSEDRERTLRASDFVLAGSSVNPLIAAGIPRASLPLKNT